jgi:hypothetical protein
VVNTALRSRAVLVGESPYIGLSSGCCAIDCEPVISTNRWR